MEKHPAIYCGHFFKATHTNKKGKTGPLLIISLANPCKHPQAGNGEGNMPQTVFPAEHAIGHLVDVLGGLKWGEMVQCSMESMGITARPALVNIEPSGAK